MKMTPAIDVINILLYRNVVSVLKGFENENSTLRDCYK